jgi:hypothetical protein
MKPKATDKALNNPQGRARIEAANRARKERQEELKRRQREGTAAKKA